MEPLYSTKVGSTVYYTNESGRGVFTERRDGTDHQHVGTSDAPRFTSDAHLGEWIAKNLDTDD